MRYDKGYVIQNPALAALVLWRFVRSFYIHDDELNGPNLPETMLVLPIVFHRRSVEAIRNMHLASGLTKALSDHPTLRVGLQDRLEALADVTFSGLNLACASGLMQIVRMENAGVNFVPASKPKTIPIDLRPDADAARDMIKTAERLGPWFAKTGLPTLCSLLQVNY